MYLTLLPGADKRMLTVGQSGRSGSPDTRQRMKFCLYMPVGNIAPGEFQSQAAIAAMAGALEDAQVDACCVTDHPAPASEWLHASGHDALDPFTALAFIAAASSSLLLQTSVLVLPYRNPFLTAKAATSLQVLSGGRFILGVGAGYQKEEFDALGVEFHRRGRLTDDALETLRLIWKGGTISRSGIGYEARNSEPRPVPQPPPPVWIGGSSEKALLRAAKYGDGWCPFFAISHHSRINRESGIRSVADLTDKIASIGEQREALGLSGDFDINIALSATDLVSRRTREEADRLLEQVSALESAGANWVTLKLAHPDRATWLENVQWFGEEIVGRA